MKPRIRLGGVLKKASPTILTCLGAAGVVATAILTAKAVPKAIEKAENNPDAISKTERVKLCWTCFVPAAITGCATIVCIFSANMLNRRQQAALAGAYTLVSHSYNDYKRKVKDLYGKEAHERIMESLAVEKAEHVHISSCGLLSASSLSFEDANEETHLFYDSYSERYFQATISQVLQAEYHLNRNFALMGGFAPLNMFYEFLGLECLDPLADEGWWVTDDLYWIDFNHSKTMIDDGLNGEIECYIIDMEYQPMNQPPE